MGQFFLGESQSRIYANMCAKCGCGPTVVSKRGGTDRQPDSQPDRQTDRQTDRHTDKGTLQLYIVDTFNINSITKNPQTTFSRIVKTTYLFDVTWSRNEAVNHVSWYAHERAEREKPSNRFSPPWEIVPEDTVYSSVFFERHDKEHLRKERVLSVYSAKRHYCFVTLTYITSCQNMPNGCTHILYCVTWHLFLTVVYVIYTTKIDGVVCPPNISETVTVRTVKRAHRPRIASTTINFISKPILLSIL